MSNTPPTEPIQAFTYGIKCPECNTQKVSKNGNRKHNKQYRCKQCGKNFSATTGTVIHGIQKREQFQHYTECLKQGMSIRKAAKHIGISIATSFAWRHKHLAAQQVTASNNLPVIATDIVVLDYSEKGNKKKLDIQRKPVKTVVITDINGTTQLRKVTTTKEAATFIRKTATARGTIASAKGAFITKAIQHISCDTIPIRKTDQCLQNKLQEVKIEVTTWLSKFRGVATRYLQQYWNWFCIIKIDKPLNYIMQEILCNSKGKAVYLTL